MARDERGRLDGTSPVENEHVRLHALLESTRVAFAEGLAEGRRALAVLGSALDAHLEHEDRLYYPTILALRPQHRGSLARISATHDELRALLARALRSAEAASLPDARAAVERLTAAFARHEDEESAWLEALEAELSAAL